MSFFSQVPRRAIVLGIVLGAVYGIAGRAAGQMDGSSKFMGVMTLGFLFVVPIVIGYLTVFPVQAPSLAYSFFGPWIPSAIILAVAVVLGWEGSICIVMASPVLLLFSSIGGLLGMASSRMAKRAVLPVLIVLPYVMGPMEKNHTLPTRITTTETSITINAPVAVVWPLVVSVDSIRPTEEPPALFTAMGFPHPISAVLRDVGGTSVRTARFTGGLVFTERVTEWDYQHVIAFSIRPNTDSIPKTTLDPHVSIGGQYFDVLDGRYELVQIDGRTTRLILRSEHRESTSFNTYAGWWADIVMRSIQRNILEVIRARAELQAKALRVA